MPGALKVKVGDGWAVVGAVTPAVDDGDKGDVTVASAGTDWRVCGRNADEVTFQSGGTPKYTVDAGTELVRIDPETGDLILGQNYLDDPDSGTNQARLADFRFVQKSLRLLLRNIALGEVGDPADINGRRFGPEGNYPYALPDNENGTCDDLTGLAAGATVFQIRATPARVPYGGNEDTPLGKAVNTGALISFMTAEMPRQITEDDDQAVGMHIDFRTCPIGANETPQVVRINSAGNLQVGRASISQPETGGMIQVRAHSGTNAVQTISAGDTVPAGGTFTLTHYPTIPADGYPTGQTTAAIAHNASAATIQTRLEALASIGVGDVTCTGGPLPGSAVVVTFTGTLAAQRWTRMTPTTSSLTPSGATFNVANTTPAIESEAGKRLLDCRHAIGASTDYFRFIDSSGNNALTLESDKTLTIEGSLDHDGTTVGFMGKTPIARPTVTGSRASGAALASLLTALDNLGLITNSSSA